MINLGVFSMYLEGEIEKKTKQSEQEKDPYNKMVIEAEISLLSTIFYEYKNLVINQ